MNPVHAPDFPHGLLWLNAAPTALQSLRGSAVALAFVDPASSWCLQRLADLALLQRRFGARLQVRVIAVPRFDVHRDPQAALKRLRRFGVSFPIAHDLDWHAWQRFGIEAWPTVVLIDAQGMVVDHIVGTPGVGALENQLTALCEPLDEPLVDTRPVETHPEPRLPLCFPTGLAVNAERLYVADTGHHQIVECTHAGRVMRRFGNGNADALDGDMEIASFRSPTHVALLRNELYVADTGNHLIRRIHLGTGAVQTLLGTGKAGCRPRARSTRPAMSRWPRRLGWWRPTAICTSPCPATTGYGAGTWATACSNAAPARASWGSATAPASWPASPSRPAWRWCSRRCTCATRWAPRCARCSWAAISPRRWWAGRGRGNSAMPTASASRRACRRRRT